MFAFRGYNDYMDQWLKLADAYGEMSMNAAEVIYRRTFRMASGAMTPPEAVAMVMEKATAFATAAEGATVAAALSGDPMHIASAALKPYRAKTRANARKLRS